MTNTRKPNLSNPEIMADAELLSTFVPKDSANELLSKFGCLREVFEAYPQELEQISGVGKIKAKQFQAFREMARRYCKAIENPPTIIRTPQDIFQLLSDMQYLSVEHFTVIFLNTKNYVIATETVSQGTLNAALVGPREVFHKAVRRMAASIVICHNHPSSDPTPSQEDIAITKKMVEAGKLLDIQVLDHVIIAQGRYVSLKEKGIL